MKYSFLSDVPIFLEYFLWFGGLFFTLCVRLDAIVLHIIEVNQWNCSFVSGSLDKTCTSLICVKCKYKEGVLWTASQNIIDGEERTWHR